MNKNKFKNFIKQSGQIKAETDELYIYGVIGDWFDELEGKQLVDKINSYSGDLVIHLNSPGGNVFDGIAVHNAIKARKGNTEIIVDGIAASIASVIAMAADKLTMAEGSFLMIHNAWSVAIGDSAEMRKMADTLDKVSGEIRGFYKRKTGIDESNLQTMMDAETWLTAKEAKDQGFADKILEDEAEIDASLDLSPFSNVPRALKAAVKGDKPKTIRDFENLLRNAGFSRSEAKAVASGGFSELDKQRDAENEDSARLLAALENRKTLLTRSNNDG